jgi:hypothetical protein
MLKASCLPDCLSNRGEGGFNNKEKVMGARCVKVAEFKCHKEAVNFCRAWGWAFVVNCNRVSADPNKCRFVVVCEQ